MPALAQTSSVSPPGARNPDCANPLCALRKWMSEEGLWLSRKQRRRFHQPQVRRDHFGELFQIDGSEHDWFEDRGPSCTLIVFIDGLRFVPSESVLADFLV